MISRFISVGVEDADEHSIPVSLCGFAGIAWKKRIRGCGKRGIEYERKQS